MKWLSIAFRKFGAGFHDQERLLRRFARNDRTEQCHCERSEATCSHKYVPPDLRTPVLSNPPTRFGEIFSPVQIPSVLGRTVTQLAGKRYQPRQ